MYVLYTVVCSQTLYFFFKVHRARVIKYKPQGQRKGVVVGEEERSLVFFLALRARSRAMFLKKKGKEK